MADTKDGRNKHARNAERRQREWELAEALKRSDETEPPLEVEEEAVDVELDAVDADGSIVESGEATE
ncbi:hypothetical protein [Natrinema gelatinilyticum]|uniref:hypothetical protein n=1 Tax=Natrinema gelatinilyticum TaxID=2961571 RepID=UPI0020C58DCC|nr:hypothetical protein [Natrinema gelatinilyticum]